MIPLTRHAGRRIAVFGLARSGLAAAQALAAGGAQVLAWDDKAERRAALPAGQLADPAALDWRTVELLVLSPGVPLTHPEPHPVVRRARAAGVPVVGDIELLLAAVAGARIVGVTGTNGKSTTTALIGHLLKSAGRACEVGGNIGTPALALEPLGAEGIYVLELSSYQIDLTPSLHCDVAVLLNITPDHLDRHGDMTNYTAIKSRIFAGQAANDCAVIGIDDAPCQSIAARLERQGRSRLRKVTVGRRATDAVSVLDGLLHEPDEEGPALDLKRYRTLPGAHNWQNAAAAYAACRALGLSAAEIDAGMASFPGLAHRMEQVAEVAGIAFVNDSKATNADAAARALACYGDIYWIAGGVPKAGGIERLRPFFPRLRKAFLIGAAAEEFARTLKGAAEYTISGSLERAMEEAYAAARREQRPGAVVLLSPAAASFDQFADYEARGRAFREQARRIVARAGAEAAT
ncbi:MAG: UDP-N-acetylmuramoyl-L-alanine--D-glutamate ligase [Alphaproteobacteria bacterium]|nr:UDP-N-acetylmuramoyl-L-alanine--D-glutamate ligase [Alphaproteobacteria bacterium]